MRRVYFIACGGRIKVGMSKDVPRRITSIAAYMDGPIELLGNIAGGLDLERAIQKKLKKFHLKGEWFKDCPEARKILARFMDQLDLAPTRKPIEYVDKPLTEAEYCVAFSKIAALIWPHDSGRHLSELTERPESECGPWLRGESVPPVIVRRLVAGELLFALTRQ